VADVKADVLSSPQAEPERVLVVEASSYQLEACKRIHPRVAGLLNISDNHLERHGTLQRYIEAKARVFANQGAADFALLNSDDAAVFALRGRVASTVVPFGTKVELARVDYGALIEYDPARSLDKVTLKIKGQEEQFDTSKVKLLGLHNRFNIATALLAARLVGADPQALTKGLETFAPLEHRLELCGRIGEALVINDSKSTTVAASVAAVRAVGEAFPQRKMQILLGGLAKAGSWDPLMLTLVQHKTRLRPIICFGKDGALLASHAARFGLSFERADTLSRAAELAMANSEGSQITLLTPGCASFDEFSDFEERGAVFKSIVAQHSQYTPYS
jgi:UDP-N-acetylmuramoylalanine--D-glutamate ligase